MNKKIFFALTLFSLLLAACGAQPTAPATPPTPVVDSGVIAEGRLIPSQDLRIYPQTRGTVTDILVKEGQSVSKGDVLVRLGDRENAEAALTAAQLELTQAQRAYDDFIRTAGLAAANAWKEYQQAQVARAAAQKEWEKVKPTEVQDEIDKAEADVRDRQKKLQDAQDEFDKYKDLKTDNPTRRKAEDELRTAQANYNEALRKVEELQRKVDVPKAALEASIAAEAEAKRKFENTMDGTADPEQKAVLEARLANAKAQLAAAEKNLANYDIRAPFSGIVTDVNVTGGELLGPEKFAAQIADFNAWYIETTDLNELEVVNIREGQRVEIKPDALKDLTLQGVVESIGLAYRIQGGDVLYKVKIKLIDSAPSLRWGMTVEVVFLP
jgi:multidrug resistance efflux pump